VSVQACQSCGGLFAHLPRGVCAGCLDQREQEFRLVRDWLRDHRGAPIAEVSAATGVDEGTIVRFIREGRIDVVDPTTDPSLRRDRDDEERRRELVRQLAEVPQFGTSVRADIAVGPPRPGDMRSSGRGMRTRRD
jgi:predicted  nucleic acid-binding Zn-ribbon protein